MSPHQPYIDKLPKVAALSHDPDTQTACILVTQQGKVETANRIPMGVKVIQERRERPEKYSWIQHAEAQAISCAARNGVSTFGSTCYLNWYPCATCAALLVQAGVKTLVASREAYEPRKDDPRYGFAVAEEMLREAGVEVVWF